jgi:Na+/glutamate symporter
MFNLVFSNTLNNKKMKKGVLVGIAALAVGVVVATLGGKKVVKPTTGTSIKKPYWENN